MHNLNTNYGYINEDTGYLAMKSNRWISSNIPYKPDVEPRLVQFLRTLTYYRLYRIKPCVPIYMEYMIKKEDWVEIMRYIKKYDIRLFM